MNDLEIQRFINLLQKWQRNRDEMTFGEISELREFKYDFADAIEKEYREYSTS